MFRHLRPLALSVITVTLAAAVIPPLPASGAAEPAPPAGNKITFKVLSGADTGLKAIMEQWKADELKRAGVDGKFKDGAWWPCTVVPFDFDNDGDLDLLVSHHSQAGCLLLKNMLKETGQLKFVNCTSDMGVNSWNLPIADNGPVIWDFDGDGFLDIGGFSDENRPKSFFNLAGKKLSPIPGFNPIQDPGPVADVNGDGYLDQVGRTSDIYTFLYDPAARRFNLTSTQKAGPPGVTIPDAVKETMEKASKTNSDRRRWFELYYETRYDLNGDGLPDVVFKGYQSYRADTFTCYLIADKDGKLTDQTEALGLPHAGTPVLVHDLNGDGNLDVVVSCGAQAGVYLGDGHGHFTVVKEGALRKFLTIATGHLHHLKLIDFNNDGEMDIVIGLPRYPTQQIYQNRGQGVFDLVQEIGNTWACTPGIDVNGDGLPDIVVGGPTDADVTIYLNQTAGSNNYCDLYPKMDKPNPFAVARTLEFFHTGDLGKAGAKALLTESSHANGTPIHLGLGQAKSFDLRVTYPGKPAKVLEFKNVAAAPRMELTAAGQIRELK